MPESDGNPMAESDNFFLPLCDKFFWGRVIIDLGTIIVPNTVRQLKFLKMRVRQVIWSMSLSGIHTCRHGIFSHLGNFENDLRIDKHSRNKNLFLITVGSTGFLGFSFGFGLSWFSSLGVSVEFSLFLTFSSF